MAENWGKATLVPSNNPITQVADEEVSNELCCSKLREEEIRTGMTVTILTQRKIRLHNCVPV